MKPDQDAARLDPREELYSIPTHLQGLSLFMRCLRAPQPNGKAVMYVHGATFPSALSVAHRFDGRSWRDSLVEAGFDVWGVDFLGYGSSGRYPEMSEPPERAAPLCRAADASRQLEAAVRFACTIAGAARLSLIAHSWGTMVAGAFAGRCPELVERIALFGPIAARTGNAAPPRLPAWRTVTLQEQWDRFVADTPADAAPVLSERHFREWGERYLGTDPASRSRTPPAVAVPLGPAQEIAEAWAGRLAYDPAAIACPVCIVRGEWDSYSTDADARWLQGALRGAPSVRDVKLPRGGHLMHLEEGRHALHRETVAFLADGRA